MTIATTEFVGLAKDTALSQGVADDVFVTVPHPIGMRPVAEIRKKAEKAFPGILKAADRVEADDQATPHETSLTRPGNWS